MRYRLRTLLILMAIAPPLIGFWPAIKRHAIVRATQVTASDVAVIAAASSFNSRATGIDDGQWLSIFVRDDRNQLIAGICGNTWGGCLEIRQFWVHESLRRKGLGTSLLAAAEQEARRRGCTQVLLMTFSFQAPAFYARHGFEVLAKIDDHPRGHQNLLLRKRLDGD
jgi:GNAT superfamily N-acetyltransferase